MLNNLISSKTRQTLLGAFFVDPEKEHYIRELAGHYHISVGTLHREITRLETSGILTSRKTANIKLFALNKRNPVYEELKGIFAKTVGAIKLIQEAISRVSGVKAAFIYGSYAKGEERPDSDIDLFILGDEVNENTLLESVNALEKKLLKEVNYTRYTQQEFLRKKRKDSFLIEVLKGKKIFIVGNAHDL